MKKFQSIFLLAILLVSLIPAVGISAAPAEQGEGTTVEIQPGAANVSDVIIQSDVGGTNPTGPLGVGESDAVGVTSIARTLINLDVSGVPYDMNVLSASLEFTVSADNSSAGCTLELYALLKDFNELDANWTSAVFPYSNWQTPGASGEEDVTVLIGSGVIADGTLVPGDKVTIELEDPSFVEEIRRDNYSGFMVKCLEESDNQYLFYSSDTAPTDTDRPKLTVTYLPDNNGLDRTSWICVEFDGSDCSNAPLSQFPNYNYTDGYDAREPGTGILFNTVEMQCDPYPRCINDYKVHYHVDWKVIWDGVDGTVDANFFMKIPGGGETTYWGPNTFLFDDGEDIPCGTGMNGSVCYGTFDGEISTDYFPRFFDGDFTLGVGYAIDTHTTLVTDSMIEYTVFFSLEPFDQNCVDTYYVPAPETYPINPAIETPLGPTGAPADYQIYSTEVGKDYMIYVNNEWFDGSNPEGKNDTAVSFDGVEWMNWSVFQWHALCVDVEPGREEDLDLRIIYFTAQTTTLYIRADDVVGEFADNTTNETDPLLHFEYTIGEALLIVDGECDSQFSFDPEGDLFAQVEVIGTAQTNPVDATFQAGEWYGIKVVSGTWGDPGGSGRTDMEFTFSTEWADLTTGSEFVWCTGSEVIYVQAPSFALSLRVNDEDNNFSNNTGSLAVEIYHVAYTYAPAGCAEEYGVDTIVDSGNITGAQNNGVAFANSLLTPTINLSYAVTPGAFYMLETRDGPWYLRESLSSVEGDYQPGNNYYDVQIKTAFPSSNSEWRTPEDWELTLCVVETDAVGHVRIYFQVPNNNNADLNQGGAEYFVRVAGAGLLGEGTMGWDLYQAYEAPDEVTPNPWEDCYSEYVTTSSLPLNSTAWIPVKDIAGTAVVQYGATGGGATVLAVDEDYWIRTSNGPWFDGEGGVEPGEGETGSNAGAKYSAQLSSDGGSTWYNLEDHPAVYCANVDQLGSYETAFFHVSVGEVWKIRVDDVETNLWTDNTGTLAYNLFALNPVGFPVNAGDVTDANFAVCAPILIKPYIPGMNYSAISFSGPEAPSSWDVSDWVLYLGEWFAALGTYIGELVERAIENSGEFFQGFGTYMGDWATYLNRSFISFFAWCPRHVNIMLETVNLLQDKEPVATFMELKDGVDTTYAEVSSYDWGTVGEGGGIGENGEEYVSIFSSGEGGGEGDNPGDTSETIFERIFPTGGPGWSVWSGEGDIVIFGSPELPSYYYICNDVFSSFLPARLRQGVCFASAHWRETGAWWWIQLSIDISSAFLVYGMIKSSAQSLIYMMTGVRPWTKDRAVNVTVETTTPRGREPRVRSG